MFSLSILVILYAVSTIEFDYDLKNLDYNNQELKAKQSIIQENMPQRSTILIEALSIDELINKAFKLQENIPSAHTISRLALTGKQFKEKQEQIMSYDFEKLKKLLNGSAKKLGFKEGYFSSSYAFIEKIPKHYSVNLKTFKDLGYEVIRRDNKFYTIASIAAQDRGKFKTSHGLYLIDAAKLVKKTTKSMFNNLLIYLLLVFSAIVFIIIFFIKKKTILALNYILFPIAMILLYLSFTSMNIMHMFSIIIIIIAGIDYGIYMSNNDSKETKSNINHKKTTDDK